MIPTWRTLLRVKEAARNAALLSAADEEMDSDDDEDGGGRGEERNGFNEDKEWPRRRIHVDAVAVQRFDHRRHCRCRCRCR